MPLQIAIILLSLIGCLLAESIHAQETSGEEAFEEMKQDVEREFIKNGLAFNFGYTFIPKGASEDATEATGYFVPTFGLDYVRNINHRWAVGAIAEIELDNYLIFEKELPRENAWILMGSGLYRTRRNWNPFIGFGWEHDIHADIFVSRIGIEKKYELGKDWEWDLCSSGI